MAELEIHQEHETEHDPTGKKVGVLAAVLAVCLALVTIESHRAHTEGIILKTEANDQWSFYQAKSIKAHTLEVGEDLIALLAPKGDAEAGHKALRFDFAEGLLEIGLVLSSLYFIARRMLFPIVGALAGLAGVAAGVAGFMV